MDFSRDRLVRSVQFRQKRALRRAFPWLERAGIHAVAADYTSPVPLSWMLEEQFFSVPSEMVGIDLREAEQLRVLEDLSNYEPEFARWPLHPAPGASFHVRNGMFEAVDAEVAYSLVRAYQPTRVIEVGSGWSTLLLQQAMDANSRVGANGTLTSIDPEPRASWPEGVESSLNHVRRPVERVPLSLFTQLGSNDILFIDSSHILRIGGDVWFELVEVLPRLRSGVVVHVHDIYLPLPYPSSTLNARDFYTEQYVLQAALSHSDRYRVLWGSSYMHLRYPHRLETKVPSYRRQIDWPTSFWFRIASD